MNTIPTITLAEQIECIKVEIGAAEYAIGFGLELPDDAQRLLVLHAILATLEGKEGDGS